ncbi:MAG TPA: hypothetical protein VHU80_24400, partial [Polyangiaceae bacterium]|nr:hypothetical protein [Polyangiaceae bacterium]
MGVVGVILVGGLLVLRSRGQATMADPSIAAGSSSAAELEALLAAPAGSTGFEGEADPAKSKILSKTSLEEAIAVARPMMSNTVGRLDVGSAQLAMWASKSLSWQALEALPETSPALFKKDPDAERGRRFCMSGTVLEIRAEKSLTNRLVEDKSLPLIEQPSAQNQGSTDTTYAHSDSPSASAEGAASAMPDPLLIQGIDFAIP